MSDETADEARLARFREVQQALQQMAEAFGPAAENAAKGLAAFRHSGRRVAPTVGRRGSRLTAPHGGTDDEAPGRDPRSGAPCCAQLWRVVGDGLHRAVPLTQRLQADSQDPGHCRAHASGVTGAQLRRKLILLPLKPGDLLMDLVQALEILAEFLIHHAPTKAGGSKSACRLAPALSTYTNVAAPE